MAYAAYPRDDRRLAIASASPRSRSAVTCSAKPSPAGSVEAESVAAGCFAATVETGEGGAVTPAEPDFSVAAGFLRAGLSTAAGGGAEFAGAFEPTFRSSAGWFFLSRRS